MNAYLTIETVESVIYKDKASKFIGFAYPVKDENEIKEKTGHVRKLHPKATHHCYAYRLGFDKNNFKAQDDGEPNGSAGKPILGQIDSAGLTNCIVIAVRYFGGTKLGISGLIDAYKETAKLTIAQAVKTEKKILNYFELKCEYASINKVYQLIHNYQAEIIEQYLENESTFIVSVEQEKTNLLESKLKDELLEFRFLEQK